MKWLLYYYVIILSMVNVLYKNHRNRIIIYGKLSYQKIIFFIYKRNHNNFNHPVSSQ